MGTREGPAASADPPIYRALVRQWASGGRTVPGRPDQEWVRLTARPVSAPGSGQVGAPGRGLSGWSPGPRDGGR
ncbi:hypothetical protein [Streptomyces sp. NPDC046887]|uniref:hypothetical protein n=1 Tax=Streptomyces sp. NPDC046887 TaxID=3155472 RepID=UPI0033FCDC70